jgi:hypothetical protein
VLAQFSKKRDSPRCILQPEQLQPVSCLSGDFLFHPTTAHPRLLHENELFVTFRAALLSLNARTT